MAVYEKVRCIHCGNNDVRKFGKSSGKQKYQCHKGCGKFFLMDYTYNARKPEIKAKILEMALNGSGVRDTSRVLKVSQTTVISTIKKSV